MTQWFGEPWPRADYRALVCEDDRLRVPVPVGMACSLCDEPITEDDQGQYFPYHITADANGNPVRGEPMAAHRECLLRNVLGCYGNVTGEGHSHDRPYRADALLVQDWVNSHDA